MLDTKKNLIGRKVYVDFPDLKLNKVLAKIDTGAYRGTLHCKDVKIIDKDDKKILSFVPHDLNHPNYSHKSVETADFSTTTVKQTNGTKEMRYVIKTRINLNDKSYDTEISLSDRTDMRSPVLIGRKFLRGKFIVDVDV